jgi:hypothetical protein
MMEKRFQCENQKERDQQENIDAVSVILRWTGLGSSG